MGDLIPTGLYEQMGKKSGHTFLSAAYSCLMDERVQRPDMNYLVHKLEKALELQLPFQTIIRANLEHSTFQLSSWKIRLADITLATDNFSDAYLIKSTDPLYDLYRAEIEHPDKENFVYVEKNKSERPKRRTTVIIKRLLPREDKIGEEAFFTDIEMLTTCKHRNIVTLLGFCDEGSEKILVVEDASNGHLLDYLITNKDKSILTWRKRLNICLDVAHALNYLHYEMVDQKTVISRDFTTSISLDENFVAKIGDFRFSVFLSPNQDDLWLNSRSARSKYYIDPEYYGTGKLKRESDVYILGVLLFEILCGRLAGDQMYKEEGGLAYVARRGFSKGIVMEMIDPIIKEESDDNNFIKTGPNKDSIDTFVKIAYRCLAETQDERPTMKVVVKELEKALSFQEGVQSQDSDQVVDPEHSNYPVTSPAWNCLKENSLKHLKIRLSDIQLATDKFSKAYFYAYEGCHLVYRAELEHFDQENISCVEEKNKSELPKRRTTVLIKRLIIREDKEREELFFKEIEMLTTCKHPNIVTLLGFCDEDSEMILVYENTFDKYLSFYIKKKPILTWAECLKICLDVAYGLEYLHYGMEDQMIIIHHDIRSSTIVVDENLGARIAIFGRSVFLPPNLYKDVFFPKEILGYKVYMDPEYMKTGKLKRESDVYSFGVVLCEMLCGRLAYDPIYLKESDRGLAYTVRRCFHEGTVKDMIGPTIKEESGDYFTLNRGPNEKSLDAFLKIAVACLVETQDERPTIKVVIKELKKALLFQLNNKDALKISLEDLQLATENFKDCVGGGGFGEVYKGKLPQSDDWIVAKRLDTSGGQGDQQFQNELQILFEYKHDNIVSLVGYCDEKDAKLIVYEYASRGSLDRYLNNSRLTWMQRLNICIDVATALDFLHRGVGTQATVIHRDMKTANILLYDDWNAKLADFGLSLISAIDQETDYVIDRACGTPGYVDPLYLKLGFLTKESDIYSFGVVLFEMLCGRSTFEIHKREGVYLPIFIKDRFQKGKHDTVVFEEIKAQIKPEALNAFQKIAYRCLNENREERPKAKEVVEQLKKALQLQVTGDLQA